MKTKIDLSSVTIDRVIVHDLPKHKIGDALTQPSYSEQESAITANLRLFFKEKIVQALSTDRAFKICFNEEVVSPVPEILLTLLRSTKADFVALSKDVGRHLFGSQDGKNAPGILLLVMGKVEGFRSCMIMKLERDKGAQLLLDPKTKAFNINEIRDLMLTEKTKVFKVALFIERDQHRVQFDGFVMDYQINVKQKKSDVLTYFIGKFLGCVPFEDPKITTQKFYNLTRTFVDSMEDPLDVAKYVQDLNSYIQKNGKTLNPAEFAEDYLKTKHKDKYRKYLEAEGFSFETFTKDTDLINTRISKISIVFDNEVTIVGSQGVLDKNVKLEELSNGKHRAEIVSRIKTVV